MKQSLTVNFYLTLCIFSMYTDTYTHQYPYQCPLALLIVLTGVIQLVAQVLPPKTTVFIINVPIQLRAHMRVYSSYFNMI